MTANRKKGEVLLELDGSDRVIKFDFNTIATLEQMHGGTPIHVLLDGGHFGISVLRSALFCAVVAGDPKRARRDRITLETAGDWLTQHSDRMEEISDAIVAAASAAMPGAVEEPAEVPTKPAATRDETRAPVREEVGIKHTGDASHSPVPPTQEAASTTTRSES